VAACANCGAENPAAQKFCGECGSRLTAVCSSCGSSNPPGQRFCGECGAALTPSSGDRPAPTAAPAEPRLAERRLVSVLFADLVGFTTLSEARDAEEVRELLSRYFDTAKRLISLYGGTVEKFIGDAVMAVWGTPAAQEDDAERAVRAALDLVAAVSALGDEVGAPELRARAGVLTGEAAVTLGAEGQGMVAGDLVNTASRIQAAAEPGAVLVGESTKRATEAAIAYAEAGVHELKGKAEPVRLYRALRVTGAVGGALKSEGLEPPFVGRERELRLVKDLFHASAEEKKAHLVSVVGVAGIGKSRLAWEFEKYIDGLADQIWWWRGRCLAYGEGVAYWALAEMVRRRADVVEGEQPESARRKLREALVPYIANEEERAWIEPRLAQLLGIEEEASHQREDLFGAWRLYFERLSEHQPAVLVFEDVQWADASLLEFVDYLLEWSHNHSIFVLSLARPELAERHAGFGAGRRNATTFALERLSEPAMEELLAGLVPGLPVELRAQILARAEGVPLYAVETVRMLLDRGLLERAGEEYRPTRSIEALEVPETLHALVAARLDGLSSEERRLVQDAAVLGKTFTKHGLSVLSGVAEAELEPLLNGLVRKEILLVQADPRSPERGQYGFVQDLLKHVAYETLAKRERKAKHLAAAAHLDQAFGSAEQEIVEVVASHYLSAYEAAPEAEDAAEIRERAGEMLARAGERAASLAAPAEAQRYFEQAAELADNALEQARLLERAGQAAAQSAEFDAAERLFQASLDVLQAEGETHAAARVASRLGIVEYRAGRVNEARDRMERAFAVISQDEPDEDLATIAAELARAHWLAGAHEMAVERAEYALEVAQALRLPAVVSRALVAKAMVVGARGRPEEHLALARHALRLALEHDLVDETGHAYTNLADAAFRHDRYGEAIETIQQALVRARKMGDRRHELFALAELTYPLFMTGRWAEALAAFGEVPEAQARTSVVLDTPLTSILEIYIHRGELQQAQGLLTLYRHVESSTDVQDHSIYAGARAALLRAEGHHADALRAGEEAFAAASELTAGFQSVKQGFVEAVEAALALDERDRARELLLVVESMPPGLRPPYLEAQASRLRARLAGTEGDASESGFKSAAGVFREYGVPFWLAVTLLEHAEWLLARGRRDDAEPLLAEASELFGRLEAKPWLERVSAASGEVVAAGAPA
jgi:class 3 adenylate cyclase/tetratricopeptide (TPR) repeat protein